MCEIYVFISLHKHIYEHSWLSTCVHVCMYTQCRHTIHMIIMYQQSKMSMDFLVLLHSSWYMYNLVIWCILIKYLFSYQMVKVQQTGMQWNIYLEVIQKFWGKVQGTHKGTFIHIWKAIWNRAQYISERLLYCGQGWVQSCQNCQRVNYHVGQHSNPWQKHRKIKPDTYMWLSSDQHLRTQS